MADITPAPARWLRVVLFASLALNLAGIGALVGLAVTGGLLVLVVLGMRVAFAAALAGMIEPRPFAFRGLALFRYRGGPWEMAMKAMFRG